MTSISSILDYLKTSSPTDTAKYLAGLPECKNPNEGSLRSAIARCREQHAFLRKSAHTKKGKADLDHFLASRDVVVVVVFVVVVVAVVADVAILIL